MITPAFELSQDHKFVYVYIKTPYIKISEVEYFIEEYQFKFYVKPYFLRLNLPGKVIENGEESASYDVDKGIFTVCLPKMVPGSYFKDLDLLTKLLAPCGISEFSAPVIEVVSDEHTSNEAEVDEENFDWEWNQDIYMNDDEGEHQLSLNGMKYGFGNQKSGMFYCLKDELKEIVENPNPDELLFSERRLARITAEDVKLDVEYYLADYFERERIQEVLNYTVEQNEKVLLTDEEKTKLRQLPNKEYLLDRKEEMSVLFSLVDIIFAFAYNKRTTLGENTVESAWTVSKLSSTLSWFESFTNLKDVLVACCRRSLAYPLYRHWELTCKVIQDVKDVFQLGRRKVLQCLLEILMLFNASEPRYLLNDLYITDYCIWIQKVKEKKLKSLSEKLCETNITKDDLGWELKDLETAALIVHKEQTNKACQINCESSSSGDSDDTAEETSSEEDSDSESVEEVNVSPKDFRVSPEVSVSVTCSGTTKGDVFERNSCPCDDDKKLSAATDERFLKHGAQSDIEILPSLLFGKKHDCGKAIIEVLDEENETETEVPGEENVCRGSCKAETYTEGSDNKGAASREGMIGTDSQKAVIENEHELAGQILKLSINDTVK